MRPKAWLVCFVCFALLLCGIGPLYDVAAQTEWTKYPGNPVLPPGALGSWEQVVMYSCVLPEVSGYRMWYTGVDYSAGPYPVLRIGLASAPDETTWTRYPGNPILGGGGPADWDGSGVGMPSLLFDGAGYRMWFSGMNYDTGASGIGYATSPDGITWSKHPGSPVLNPGLGQWDSVINGGRVVYHGGQYKMWYTGYSPTGVAQIGYATSPDEINWVKHWGNPVLTVGSPGDWDDSTVGYPSVIFNGTAFEMWFGGLDSSGTFRVGYATSPDGVDWVKHGSNPILEGSPGEWDESHVTGPFVILDAGDYHMWYSGLDSTGGSGIGYAYSLPTRPPILAGGKVSPLAGMVDSTFIYNVTYRDGDNDPAAFVRVWINKSGVPVGASPYGMSFDSWMGAPDDWSAGANFVFSVNLSGGGSDYTFTFSASDGEKTVFSPERAGPAVSSPFGPPSNIEASLSGAGFSDVTIHWWASDNDTGPGGIVERYDILHSSVFDTGGTGYSLLASVPAVGLESYFYDHVGGGEGDPSNYFYVVCAINALNATSCASGQAGKFTRLLSMGPNLVSVPLNQSDETIETVLQTVKYDKAWVYDISSGGWNWYMKHKGYRRGLWNVDQTTGLWVNVTEFSRLTVAGAVPMQTVIHMQTGWNLVSFPSFNTSYTVADLKAETGATRVEGMETMPPYPPCRLRVLSDLDVFLAGEAYWVEVEADVDWMVEVS